VALPSLIDHRCRCGTLFSFWIGQPAALPPLAAALSAVLKQPDIFRNKKVGVILTGGNVDLDNLPWRMQPETGPKQTHHARGDPS
ncbi:MAG: hypothetical protein VW499_07450, partial [Candidatus Puniceispirillum sp.]